MLLDYENLYSNAQAITADAASTNIIDHGDAKDKGPGREMELLIQVVEDFATLTSLTVKLQTDHDVAFGSATDLQASAAIAAASLVAGYTFKLRIPYEGLERYTRLYYDVGGSNATAGKITAGLVYGREQSYQ